MIKFWFNQVWKVFKCKTLEDYHNLYLELDTVLLADVFERFRSESIKVYELDPVHFCTAPTLSWHACLKYTRVTLDILTDPNMNIFINGKFYFVKKSVYIIHILKVLLLEVFRRQETHFYKQTTHLSPDLIQNSSWLGYC